MELGGRSWLSASGTFGIRSGHTAAPSTSILAVAGKKPSSLLSRSVSQATAPGSPTRELLQRRKLDGDGGMEALRVLKRRLSDVVYPAMLTDQNQSLSAVA